MTLIVFSLSTFSAFYQNLYLLSFKSVQSIVQGIVLGRSKGQKWESLRLGFKKPLFKAGAQDKYFANSILESEAPNKVSGRKMKTIP